MVTFPVIQDERYTMALRLKAVFPRRARSYLVPLLFFECGLSFLSIICNYRKNVVALLIGRAAVVAMCSHSQGSET